MKPFVDVEGSGEGVTRVTATGGDSPSRATVIGADDSELRQLTVESNGGGEFATAVLNGPGATRFEDVTARASGAAQNRALSNSAPATSLRGVTLHGEGVVGVGLSNRGGPGTVTVQGSVVGGSSASVLNTSRYEVRVGSSQLSGPIDNSSGGVFRCAAVYDETFAPLDEGCSAEGACVDADGDGAFATRPGCGTAPFDCDDNNASISPFAPEVCNRLDDDCDGQVDEGCPTTAVLSISPASHDFGDVQVITGSATRTFVVTNVGAGVSGPPLATTSGDPVFSVQSQCGAQLGPGASCSADVSFAPQSLGPSSGGVLSVTASPGGHVQASLSGTGVCVPDGQEDLPDPSFLDTDCDGIDGSIAGAVFVDAVGGDDAAPGTMSQPKRTLGAAIASAGARDVYASNGV